MESFGGFSVCGSCVSAGSPMSGVFITVGSHVCSGFVSVVFSLVGGDVWVNSLVCGGCDSVIYPVSGVPVTAEFSVWLTCFGSLFSSRWSSFVGSSTCDDCALASSPVSGLFIKQDLLH